MSKLILLKVLFENIFKLKKQMIDKNIERGVYDPAILDYYDDDELEFRVITLLTTPIKNTRPSSSHLPPF